MEKINKIFIAMTICLAVVCLTLLFFIFKNRSQYVNNNSVLKQALCDSSAYLDEACGTAFAHDLKNYIADDEKFAAAAAETIRKQQRMLVVQRDVIARELYDLNLIFHIDVKSPDDFKGDKFYQNHYKFHRKLHEVMRQRREAVKGLKMISVSCGVDWQQNVDSVDNAQLAKCIRDVREKIYGMKSQTKRYSDEIERLTVLAGKRIPVNESDDIRVLRDTVLKMKREVQRKSDDARREVTAAKREVVKAQREVVKARREADDARRKTAEAYEKLNESNKKLREINEAEKQSWFSKIFRLW